MPHRHPFINALLIALGTASALAQPADPPVDDEPDRRPDARSNPALTDYSLEESMRERTTRPDPEGSLLPTIAPEVTQVVPNQPLEPGRFTFADGSRGWVEARTLLPEGTFLVRRLGEVVRLSSGGLAFLPVRETEVDAEPAMPLLPCEVYARLAALMEGTERGLWLSVTGEVFQYNGRNYLLPSAFAAQGAPAEASPAPEPSGDPAPDPSSQPGVDPRIDELVRELEAQREERKGIDTSFPTDAPAEGGAAPGPRIEGRMLFSRRGRMVRSSAGGWVIALDNDTDAAVDLGLPERLRLLPCRLVDAMERQAESRGEAWTFEVSGNLYRFGEGVYLLPRLYVSLPSDDVNALQ